MKMTEAEFLTFLQTEQEASHRYTSSEIEADREQSQRDYLRKPYGNELEGRSRVVSSDVFDTIEGILPDLLDVFVSSDKAVIFEPVGPEDAEGAEQATNACNYVFYKQNNGFLILYTALKDALLYKTGAIKWWWDVTPVATFTTYTTDEMQLAVYLTTHPDAQILEQEEVEPSEQEQQMALQGFPVPRKVRVKIKTVEKKGRVKVAAIPPEELRVSTKHDSPDLCDTPYAAHVYKVTLSQLRGMGFDVSEDDVTRAHDNADSEAAYRSDTLLNYRLEDDNASDPTTWEGWLREEYVLVDFDGDGISERRRVLRLGDLILENKEVSHVQIAAFTPYILTHQFHGLSVADLLSDIQKISTDIWRQQLDNLDLANNQETVVLTDSQGNPLADLDDLLNRRPGGIIREKLQGAVRPYVENWKGIESLPMVEVMAGIRESRTGYTRYSQGMDAESLNKTATGITKIMNATQKRMRLMARIMAECLVAPMFRGIFKTLTDYCMEPLSMRLNGGFTQYDPQEWRDGYDMTVNVGLGTGDNFEQMQYLQQIAAAQMAMMQSPMGGRIVNEANVYKTHARIAEKAGFKNPGEFWTDPTQLPPRPPPPPPPEVIKAQAEMQFKQQDMQMKGAQLQADMQHQQQTAAIELQKAQVELQIKQAELELKRQALQLKAEEAALDAQIAQQRAVMQASDDMARAQRIQNDGY